MITSNHMVMHSDRLGSCGHQMVAHDFVQSFTTTVDFQSLSAVLLGMETLNLGRTQVILNREGNRCWGLKGKLSDSKLTYFIHSAVSMPLKSLD